MKQFKGTPGPWFTESDSQVWNVKEGEYSQSAIYVAEAFNHDNPAQMKADTQLIAAAPELLEALQEMVKIESRIYQKKDWRETESAVNKAKAAINKALGVK